MEERSLRMDEDNKRVTMVQRVGVGTVSIRVVVPHVELSIILFL